MFAPRQRVLRASKFLAVLAAFAWSGAQLPAWSAERYAEAAVKAAFIHRFAGYVEWPPEATAVSRLRIAVVGDAEVTRQLAVLASRASASGREIDVFSTTRDAQLRTAHIVFIGAGTSRDLRFLISGLANRPVLIVTDEERGLDFGAAVNFLLVDQRVRFEVSVTAAEQAGLRISSDLLSVAVRVVGSRRSAQASDASP